MFFSAPPVEVGSLTHSVKEGSFLFPGVAALNESSGAWTAQLGAWCYRSAPAAHHELVLGVAQKILGGFELRAAERNRFESRAKMFLSHASRGRRILLRLGRRLVELGSSGTNGHLRQTFLLPRDELAYERTAPACGWLPYSLLGEGQAEVPRSAGIQLLSPKGLSIISDVDDTLKESFVFDKRRLLYNTFFEEYRPVAGMVEVFREWEAQGAAFHYVSTTPWPLYKALAEFFADVGYPRGTFHLKPFCWRDFSWLELLRSPLRSKPASIEPLLHTFPKRHFVLVGDSSEKDPEIYATLAKRYRSQVKAILIRMVPGAKRTEREVRSVLGGLRGIRTEMFESSEQLTRSMFQELAEETGG